MNTPDDAGRGIYRGLTEGQKENRFYREKETQDAWGRAAQLCAQIALIDHVREQAGSLCVASSGEREARRLKKEIEEVIRSAYQIELTKEAPPEPAVFETLRRIDWEKASTDRQAFMVVGENVYTIEAEGNLRDVLTKQLYKVAPSDKALYAIDEPAPAPDAMVPHCETCDCDPPAPPRPPDETLPALEELVAKLKPVLAPGVEVRSFYRGFINFVGPKGNHTFWDAFRLRDELTALGNELAAKNFLSDRRWLLEELPAETQQAVNDKLNEMVDKIPVPDPALALADFVDELRNALGLDEYIVHLFHAGPASSQANEIVVHRFAVNARNEMACETVATFPFETMTAYLQHSIAADLEKKTGKRLEHLKVPEPAPLTHDGQPVDDGIGRLTEQERKRLEVSGMFMSEDELRAKLDEQYPPLPTPKCPPVVDPEPPTEAPWPGIMPEHMNALLAHVRQNWIVVEKACVWRKTNMANLAAEMKIQHPNGAELIFPLHRDQRPEDHSTYERLEESLHCARFWRKGEATQ